METVMYCFHRIHGLTILIRTRHFINNIWKKSDM